jgi:glycosyltransferase involved in cell wall biosynthesis
MKKSICFIAASEITVKAFLIDHLRALAERYEISVVVNTNDRNFLRTAGLEATVIPVGIKRKISLIHDIRAIVCLFFLFRKKRYEAVHSITPKAGLLAMIAAYFAHTPLRVHTFTGQVWATRVGVARWFFKGFDRLIVSGATHILVDSYSQKDFLISEKVVQAAKAQVLANGSICGVNTGRFLPNLAAREIVRKELGIDESAILFLYLGRLAEDKGLLDLAAAFQRLNERFDEVHFLIVGPDEEGMKHRITRLCEVCLERLHFVDFTATPENFMAAADVFCLASYREGFGMAVIEAAAVGIPAIATRIYGVTDAVDDNVTGFLYEPRNVNELTEKMLRMVKDPQMRLEMGRKARERVIRLYSAESVSSAFLAFYQSVLAPQ